MSNHEHGHRELRDLLTDAVDDVEPRYALDLIRARSTTARSRRPYAAGGALLAVAASVTAFALITDGGTPRATDPVASTSSSPTRSSTPAPSDSPPPSTSATEVPSITVPVYYVGDTPDGPRLYREFRTVQASNPFDGAIAALEQGPIDPDYRTYWPEGSIEAIHFDGIGEDGLFQVVLNGGSLRDRPAGMDEATASMAVEQVIHTLQASAGARAAVTFRSDSNPIDQVFGVPTSEPRANGPVLDTLALVSLSTPSEGMVVDNDVPLVVEGVGSAFEGTIDIYVRTRAGGSPGGENRGDWVTVRTGMGGDRLYPFTANLDLTGVPPGDYVVVSMTQNPSGEAARGQSAEHRSGSHDDSRNITIVE